MTKQKKLIWIIGNVVLGMGSFYAFLWGLFIAWGYKGNFALFSIGAVTLILIVFAVFNFLIISSEKLKYWVISFLLLICSAGGTILVHGILQNTLLE